jgi:hypothetical protein
MMKIPRSQCLAGRIVKPCLAIWLLVPQMNALTTLRIATLCFPASNQSKDATSQPGLPQPSPDIFRVLIISNGTSYDKVTWSEDFNVVAPNGNMLFVSNTPFSSTEVSDKQFQLLVKSAAKILRRGPELNENGKVVGERVLCLFSPVKAGGPSQYNVIWTSGAVLWRLSGEHLEDVQSLENRLNAEGTRALWKWATAQAKHP